MVRFMKRSEMLQLMFNSLSEHWNNQNVPTWDLKEQCIILLEKMERAGMKPPQPLGEVLSDDIRDYLWEPETTEGSRG